MLPLAHVYPVKRKDRVSPLVYRMEERSLAAVGDLIQTARELIGNRRKEVLESLSHFHHNIPPNILQGLLKLLTNKADFGVDLIENPEELRAGMFETSFDYWKNEAEENTPSVHQANIIARADLPEILKNADPEDWLYCDVESNQIMKGIGEFTPQALINEFNISQVQGLLMQSTAVHLSIEKINRADLRMLMQYLKFFGLLFTIRSQSPSRLELTIDGPASVLQNGRSYGFEIAKLFPLFLNLSNPWQLGAEVKLKNSPIPFSLTLTEKNPYQPVYRQTGIWKNEKIAFLVESWNGKHPDLGEAAHSDRLIALSRNRYLLPDIEIVAKDSARRLCFDWQRYVNEAYWEKLLALGGELPKDYFILLKAKDKDLPQKIQNSPVFDHLIPHRQEPLLSHLKSKLSQ